MDAQDPSIRPDPPELLHVWFERRAAAVPDAPALRLQGRSATFADLARQARAVAAGLAARDIGEGALVGLHVERSVEQVAAMLGILAAGAAVVPLPPSDPDGRLRRILSFGGLAAVVDDEASPVDPSAGRVLRLPDLLEGQGETAPEPAGGPGGLSPDAPAFVLSSSGSTGHPKMIVRSHRSFFHRLRWTWDRHPFAAGALGCQKAHMTTTHSLYELFEPLLAGAPTLLVPDRVARNLEAFWETLRAEAVTRLLIVPSALRASLAMPDFVPPPLEVAVLMGEYVAPDLALSAVEAFPEATALYSIYGSTEASSTLVVDLRVSARPGQELPLGKPITPEVRALVLDEALKPVSLGAEGRLYMAGPPLFSGYWKDPEQTAAVLLDPPGRDGPLYDTRDRVRRAADGSLHFRGRVDHMVKIRGFRVDLAEVERVLLAHPDVRQAAVAVEGEGTAEAALLAFHVPADVDRDELFALLRDRLPHYMVPSSLHGLDAFPRTASAKIDRVRLLRERVVEVPEAADRRDLTETERRVAQAWAETLGHERFGADRSFFEVGGTSLTVFSLVHRLRGAFDLDRARLPEEALYRFPTVEALAAHLDDLAAGRAVAASGPTPLLVTLRGAAEGAEGRPPLFVVASAGGTLGAYEKLAAALPAGRAVVGVRDPFLWGERAPWDGFRSWIDRYESAILERQPEGPYHVCAYSSAGAFGYEIARRLREAGREVALLALVDPLALDRGSPRRFGHWALRATWEGRIFRTLVGLFGRLRTPAVRLRNALRPPGPPPDHALSREAFAHIAEESRRNPAHLMTLAALLELNTGLPFALEEEDFAGVPPEGYLEVFQERVAELTPQVDPATMERIVIQYEDQVRAQHAYELRPFDGRVLLVEPETAHAGLLAVQLRPYVAELRARVLPLGEQTERERAVSARFGGLQGHYRSMRDDGFVAGLAQELNALL